MSIPYIYWCLAHFKIVLWISNKNIYFFKYLWITYFTLVLWGLISFRGYATIKLSLKNNLKNYAKRKQKNYHVRSPGTKQLKKILHRRYQK